MRIDITEIFIVDDLADPAVFGIALLVVPFGRVVKPTEQEGTKGGAVRENEEGIDAAFFIVAPNGAHELMNADRHVEGAFTKRQTGVEFAEIVDLTLVFSAFVGVFLQLFLKRQIIEKTVLLFDQGDILADIGDAECFVELLRGLARSHKRASPDACTREVDPLFIAVVLEKFTVDSRLLAAVLGQ